MDRRKGLLLVLEYPGGKDGGMNTKRYCEQVLNSVWEDFYAKMSKECSQVHFQQDNVLCHVSKQTKKWFNNHGISLLFHALNSPDLSPIEHVWHKLKTIIWSLTPQPTTVNRLKAAVHTA
jgi:hypothetical protein